MKTVFTTIIAILIGLAVFAQTPQSINYQAVLRNSSGEVLANQEVEIGIAILQGGTSGLEVFAETHSATTNSFGLANLQIGSVNTSGMGNIDWGDGPYFVQVSVNGTAIGTSQLLSVPYAMYAGAVENDKVDDADNDPANELQDLALSGTNLSITQGSTVDLSVLQNGIITESDPVYSTSQAVNITATDITNLGNLSGTNSGDQDLSNLATQSALADSTAKVQTQLSDSLSTLNIELTTAIADSTAKIRSEIPDVSGFISNESDPVYAADSASINSQLKEWETSVAKGITATDTANWNNKLDSYTESDPVFSASEAANITATDITNLGNLSGTNSGDQDLSSLATKTALADSTAKIRSEIPDVSGFISNESDPVYAADSASINAQLKEWETSVAKGITASDTANWNNKLDSYTESDPVFSASEAANITATDITNLGNLSGTNTGDQDLSNLATLSALADSTAKIRTELSDSLSTLNSELSTAIADSTAKVRSEIPDVSGFISSESDPVYAADSASINSQLKGWEISVAKGIIATDTINWNSKVDTLIAGNGILIVGDTIKATSTGAITEQDPVYVADSSAIKTSLRNWETSVAKGITTTDITNWYEDISATNEIELPSQSGNSGKYLTTNGSTAKWKTITTLHDALTLGTKNGLSLNGQELSLSTATTLKAGAMSYSDKNKLNKISSTSTTASGSYSTAMGYMTTASGSYSTSMGYKTTAGGDYSTSMGYSTKASGQYSIAIGLASTASETYSVAMGCDATASGKASTSIGYSTTASGSYSTAMGYNTTASGSYSTAMGRGTNAIGSYSIAMGYNTTASSNYSTVMGYETTASKEASTAMGYNTTASGDYSTSMGYNSTASKEASTAMGYNTTASGDYSTSMGYNTTSSGEGSTAIGSKINVKGSYSVGIGLDGTKSTLSQASTMAIMGGKVGIGTVSPSYELDVWGSGRFVGPCYFTSNVRVTGDLIANNLWSEFGGGGTQYRLVPSAGFVVYLISSFSDSRLKENVETIKSPLQKIQSLRGVTYNWNSTAKDIFINELKENTRPNQSLPEAEQEKIMQENIDNRLAELSQTEISFIAQEVEEVFPQWVSEDENGYKKINMKGLNSVLVEAVKELKNEKDEEIAKLQQNVEALKAENGKLKAEKDAEVGDLKQRLSILEALVEKALVGNEEISANK